MATIGASPANGATASMAATHVQALGLAVVVLPAEVEAQRGDPGPPQGVEDGGHDGVVAVAPVERMGMGDEGGRAIGAGDGQVAFQGHRVDRLQRHGFDRHGHTVPSPSWRPRTRSSRSR